MATIISIKPYHLARGKTRTYHKTFQLSTLLVGFPGFVVLLFGQLARSATLQCEAFDL